MIDFFHATLLGLVQGLTEFLPISSSAHLMLFQHFLGLKEPEVLLDVLLHVGTLISLPVHFCIKTSSLKTRTPASGEGSAWDGRTRECVRRSWPARASCV
jgi:undecaprenyl pyrophosphate phosphatase UppP